MNKLEKNNISIKSMIKIILEISGPFIMFLMFFYALISPSNNISFIFNSVIFIVMVEFIYLHFSFMTMFGVFNKFLWVFYLLFVLPIGFTSNNAFPAIIISFKMIKNSFAEEDEKGVKNPTLSWGTEVLLYTGSLFFVLIIYAIITKFNITVRFPEIVYASMPINSNGNGIDNPIWLTIWGTIYYLTNTILLTYNIVRKSKKEEKV